jgi:hypothetical protein
MPAVSISFLPLLPALLPALLPSLPRRDSTVSVTSLPRKWVTSKLAVSSSPEETPLFEPRDAISLAYLTFGAGFTAVNVFGQYDHYTEVVGAALALGCVSAMAMVADAIAPPALPSIDGPGYVNRATITRFGAAYAVAAMFVCWRTGPYYPTDHVPALLVSLDPALNLLAAAAFVFGLIAPIASLVSESERAALTPVRALLLRGSAIQNVIGATFLPVVLTMAARGGGWWAAVHEIWPYQQLLEPSTSTFACLCVDAGLLSMRLAVRDKISWGLVVGVGVSTAVVLAVVPCFAFLTYNEGLFDWFSLYTIEV